MLGPKTRNIEPQQDAGDRVNNLHWLLLVASFFEKSIKLNRPEGLQRSGPAPDKEWMAQRVQIDSNDLSRVLRTGNLVGTGIW